MENKRDHSQLESEFHEARSTASCISDLLMASTSGHMTLDDSTIADAGFACFNQVKIMGDLFAELLDLHVAEKRK